MKEKIYTMNTTAIDAAGNKHEVVMVGVYTQEKVQNVVHKIVQVPVSETKTIDGDLIYNKPGYIRRLKYAYAICHPDDIFSVKQGEEIAIKRAKTNPMGELETKLITTLCKDQIKLILYGEMQYIVNNIDKFIKW